METIVARSCGLDVHQATVVACILIDEGKRHPRKQIRTFGTMRADLEELATWLSSEGVTHVAMEGTGVYWRPVHSVLEGRFDLTIANARHIKKVPGRKTDVSDAEWLAKLLRMGLLRKSFIPAKAIRQLRDVSRYRRTLVQSHSSERNRVIKLLEVAGIKLASVASDVFGASGMAMLRAIAEGGATIAQLAQLARGKLRAKIPDLERSLDVMLEDHHRYMLRKQLARLAQTDADIAEFDQLIANMVAPWTEQIELLKSIHGIDRIAATEIFSEIGPDLASFPDEAHFASWSGTCPGNNESAGKHKGARARRGNPYLQSMLVEAALAATRKSRTYLRDKYYRLKARRGAMRALFAIAHKLATAVYRVLTTRCAYRDLGESYLDGLDQHRVVANLVRRLERLGFNHETIAPWFASSARP
jgi:transposase